MRTNGAGERTKPLGYRAERDERSRGTNQAGGRTKPLGFKAAWTTNHPEILKTFGDENPKETHGTLS